MTAASSGPPLSRRMTLVIWAVALALFVLPMDVGCASRWTESLLDLLHFPLFAMLMWSLLRRGMPLGIGCSIMALSVAAVEWIQPWVGREAQLQDALLGAAGAAVVVAWNIAGTGCDRRKRALWRGTGILLVSVTFLPPMLILLDRWEARRAFPVLASFRSSLEMTRWKGQCGDLKRVKRDGRGALRFEVLPAASYPGVFLVEAPRDWRGMKSLQITVDWSGREPREFWARVDDRPDSPPYADRVQVATILHPGVQRWSVPLDALSVTPGGRPFDFSRVVSLGVFMGEGRAGEGFDLLEVRLAPEAPRVNSIDCD